MLAIQFDLFEENTEINILRKEIEAMAIKDSNVRRGLFARYDSLCKTVVRQQEELDELKGAMLKLKRVKIE